MDRRVLLQDRTSCVVALMSSGWDLSQANLGIFIRSAVRLMVVGIRDPQKGLPIFE
jgi:hypothetical protein